MTRIALPRPNRHLSIRPGSFRGPQRGVVLLVALIVLVAMSLAGIGLTRSVDSTTGVAGNLAFRQSAIPSSDLAVEQAIQFLEVNRNSGALNADVPAQGYYAAASMSITDWSAYNWAGRSRKLGADTVGNSVEYVVERLCNLPGSYGTGAVSCVTKELSVSEAGNSKGAGNDATFTNTFLGYRITTRVTDPKGATTYTQVNAH